MAKVTSGIYKGKTVKINPCAFYEQTKNAQIWIKFADFSETACGIESLILDSQEALKILDNSKSLIDNYIFDLDKMMFERRQTNE